MTTDFPTEGASHPPDSASSLSQTHVAMIVANDMTVDTRVRKMAAAVAETGLDVTVLAISPSEEREEGPLGAAKLIRLAVAETLSDSGTDRRFAGFTSDHSLRRSIQSERERFQSYQRDIGARIGWLRRDYFEGRTHRQLAADSRQAQSNEEHSEREEKRKSQPKDSSGWALKARKGLTRVVRRADRYGQSMLRGTRNRWRKRVQNLRESRFRLAEKRIQRRLEGEQKTSEERVRRLIAELTSSNRVPARPDWRTALPELHDFDSSFGPELDALDPDVIHVHDVHLLGVAVRAAARSYVRGRFPKVIYDAHEYIQGLGTYRPATVAGFASLEREYIGRVDRVITVSNPLADLLINDYQLRVRPEVVMNIPEVASGACAQSVRTVAGLTESDKLVVYSGGLDPTRGVHTLVKAIGQLDSVHLVLVSNTDSNYRRALEKEAENGGFSDRVHVVPFVPSEHVVPYLATADVAVHPMVSGPINHEVALPNKLFEYIHALLPIVVSDCRAMSELVKELGVGEVFVSEDVESLVGALEKVAANTDQYVSQYGKRRELLKQFSWDWQKAQIRAVYSQLQEPEA